MKNKTSDLEYSSGVVERERIGERVKSTPPRVPQGV